MRYGGLIIAIVVAALAAFAVMKMSANNAPAPNQTQPLPQQGKTVNVYIATKPIPIGTSITEDMVGIQPWPEHLLVDGFVVADGKNNIAGMVSRGQYQQNEPFIKTKLANPNDPSFLAGDLPAGMRVVTIPINEVDGIAGFVFPGDHVDLIYTHDVVNWISAPDGSSSRYAEPKLSKTTFTETLLTNVKVLAIDQRASGAGSTDKNGNLIVPRSASVMVSQEDAQRVRLAQKTGTISLVLRSLADRESTDPILVTAPTDISQIQAGGDKGVGDGVKIVRGAPDTKKENETSPAAPPSAMPLGATVNPSPAAIP